ncbi:MAG: MFS transporter, partial [Bifidobacteriaceae bacterium]|nr:MFS transporter [Bifidobacteriaceae bacterium]
MHIYERYGRLRRYAQLILGTLSLFILGLIYAWSIFSSFLGVTKVQSSVIFSTTMICLCAGCVIAARLTARFTPRVSVWASAAGLAIGFVGTVLATRGATPPFAVLFVFYGVIVGLGCGFGYNAIITTVNLWFPDKLGLATGVQLLGFGLSGLVLGTAAHRALGAFGWRAVFLAVAAVGLVVIALDAWRIKAPRPDEALQLRARAQEKAQARAAAKAARATGTPNARAAKRALNAQAKAQARRASNTTLPGQRRRADLVVFYIWRTLGMAACVTLVGSSGGSAQGLGAKAGQAALLVGLVAAANGISRVTSGLIYDHTSIRALMGIVSVLMIAGCAAAATACATHQVLLFCLAAIVLGYSYGTFSLCAATYARERFPVARYPMGMAFLNTAMAFASFTSMGVVWLGAHTGGDLTVYLVF